MEPETPAPRKRATPAAKRTPRTTARTSETAAEKPVKARARKTESMVEAAPPRKRAPAKSQPVLDETLLTHLDQVLADLEPIPVPAVAPTAAVPAGNAPLWARIVADPGFAAEHLVRDAVRRTGPEAREWVDRMRRRYPGARDDALARLAVDEHIRSARRQGAGAAVAGPAGAWLGLGLRGRTGVRLALTVAAVYGSDPTGEARVRDLLELLRVPRLTQPAPVAVGNLGRLAGGVAVVRAAARLMPFGSAVAGAVHSGRACDDLARRAIDRYRPKRG